MRLRIPHTLVLLFGMVVFALVLTYLLPAGTYERVTNDHDREVVVPGTYKIVEVEEEGGGLSGHLLRIIGVFLAIPKGFTKAQDIIFFVFIIGGAFRVLRATGAIDAFLGFTLSTFGSRRNLLIGCGLLVFTVGSSTLGMAEEYLPFVAVLVALSVGMRLDPVVGVGIISLGCGIGYGCAAINPFTVIIAQGVAGLEPTSGAWYRIVLTVPFFLLGFFHLSRYAKKISEDPSKSLVADLEPAADASGSTLERVPMTGRLTAILLVTFLTIIVLVVGIAAFGWYLVEMGALFLGLSCVIAILAPMSPDKTARHFCEGAAELTTTALLIGFARAIQGVLEDGQVIDTIIHGIATQLQNFGPSVAAAGMFLVQSLINFFVPSGSGQAYVTMPIMAPLADLTGLSRQISVLAYQFGDGFTNILVPTNAVTMGFLAIARIPYDRWFRFLIPFMIQVWVLGTIALMVAVWIGYE